MRVPGVKPVLLNIFTSCIFSLFLFSCQGLKEDNKKNYSLPEADSTSQISAEDSVAEIVVHRQDSRLDSVISYLHKKKGFNGTVLVTKFDQVIYKGAFGYADFYHKDTLSTQTTFQLASVSKQFTAMAIMMLQEQGRLGYDDTVDHILPGFPYKGITVRHLLTHRSGLPNYTYFSEKLWSDRNLSMTNDDMLRLMEKHKPAVYFKPNRRFDYSNTGYALLASIVEKTSGMPFSTFLQKHIFDPLKMNNTFTFSDSLARATGLVATGHTGGKRKRTHDYTDTVLGDKGVYSNVDDLYRWDQALYTQKLVKKETLEEAFKGSGFKRRNTEDYGFGWRIRELESGDKVVYHAGLWHGYTSYLLRNPKDHSALIVLSNLPNGSLKRLKDEIQDLLYPVSPTEQAAESYSEPSPVTMKSDETEPLNGFNNLQAH